jgi:hypothetical protein
MESASWQQADLLAVWDPKNDSGSRMVVRYRCRALAKNVPKVMPDDVAASIATMIGL